jgi:hypothetical protein
MRVFMTRWFARYARREGLALPSLIEAIERAEKGLIDADLGGGLIKQRVARPGKGRTGGYRTVIAYRTNRRAVFIYGLAKSDRENFAESELEAAREIASIWLPANEEQIVRGLKEGSLVEVEYGKEKAE